MVMVVKQPRVDVAFAQGRLDGRKVHEQTSIVNNAEDLGESPRGPEDEHEVKPKR
jgi:hypothetical protein